MGGEQTMLGLTALGVGAIHTLLGPDHYLPFIALARSRRWSRRRTLLVTLACGLGHLAGSIALGALGLALGWGLADLSGWEERRGALAGWLLVGFGLAYLAWGIRRAVRTKPHSHPHVHADGTLHSHRHDHLGAHAHPHESRHGARTGPILAGTTAWTLFIVFVLGPCEPLIPLIIYPAATADPLGVAWVVALFAAGTLGTMAAVVLFAARGLESVGSGPWERWSHAVAGGVIAACGLAIQFGL